MFTILVSVAAGLVVGGFLRVIDLVHSIPGAIFPAVVVTLIVAILLLRRISTLVAPSIEEIQGHMQGGRVELALASMRKAMRWAKWQPLLEGQLRMQIGALHYMQKNYDEAIVELAHAAKTPWESRAFLACAYFKKKDTAPMTRAFEDAVKVGEKEDLVWTIYAWCLNAASDKDGAQKVLERGLVKLPANPRLQANLEALKEGKKFKTEQQYGDRWARFGLDNAIMTGGREIPKAMRGYAQRPGFRNKPQRKR